MSVRGGILVLSCCALVGCAAMHPVPSVRFATFNAALSRDRAGALADELEAGSEPARAIAAIIQQVRPDVLVLNEFDYDESNRALRSFVEDYLGVGQGSAAPLLYEHRFVEPVNTGVASGFDFDGDGRLGGPGDAHGFGRHPGQYGMVLFSRFPIRSEWVRTFRHFRWAEMPNSKLPEGDAPWLDGREHRRLSSKSHWSVPIELPDGRVVHTLVSHPTPPAFDGPEDRNGRRNYDEIRFWADYIAPDRCGYIVDDQGRRGGLGLADFVIAGDLNADPCDGDATDAIRQLLEHGLVREVRAMSRGGRAAAGRQGGVNWFHRGPATADTADFDDDRVGNLRVDYVLPSRSLDVVGAGVFWPAPDEPFADLVEVSDHRLVWVDISLR